MWERLEKIALLAVVAGVALGVWWWEFDSRFEKLLLSSVTLLVALAICLGIALRKWVPWKILGNSSERKLIRRYRRRALDRYRYLVPWFAPQQRIELLKLYRKPQLARRSPSPGDAQQSNEGIDLFAEVEGAIQAGRPLRRVIVGDVGSGKSSLLDAVAVHILNWQSPANANLVVVRSDCHDFSAETFGEYLAGGVADILDAHWRESEDRGTRVRQDAASLLRRCNHRSPRKQLLILLDGLDEIGEQGQRTAFLKAMRKYLEAEDKSADGLRPHVLLTVRPVDFVEERLTFLSEEPLDLPGFDRQDIRALLSSWPEVNGKRPVELDALLDDDDATATLKLCETPLLLTLLISLFVRSPGPGTFRLPRSKLEFYERIVTELLISRPGNRGREADQDTAETKQRALQVVARGRFRKDVSESERERIPGEAIVKAVTSQLKQRRQLKQRDDSPELLQQCVTDSRELVRQLVEENCLLQPERRQGHERPRVYRFPHRSILEYFAARELRATLTAQQFINERQYANDPEFFEVGRWFCAIPGGEAGPDDPVEAFVTHYLQQNPPRLREAALCLLAAQDVVQDNRTVNQVAVALQAAAHDTSSATLDPGEARLLLAELAINNRELFTPMRQAFTVCVQRMLGGADTEISVERLRRLVIANPRETIPMIELALRDPSGGFAATCVEALERAGTEPAVRALIAQLKLPRGDASRCLAARALCRLLTSGDHAKLRLLRDCWDAPLFPVEAEPVWPWNAEFPRHVAVPLIDSFRSPGEVCPGLPLLSDAVAIRLDTAPARDRRLNRWARLPQRYRLLKRLDAGCLAITAGTWFVALALLLLVFVATLWLRARRQVVALDPRFHVTWFSPEFVQSLREAQLAGEQVAATTGKHVKKSVIYRGSQLGPDIRDSPEPHQKEAYAHLQSLRTLTLDTHLCEYRLTEEDRTIALELGVAPVDFETLRAALVRVQGRMQQEPQWRDQFLLPAPQLCGRRFFDTLFGGACCMVMLSYGMLVVWGVVLNRSESDLRGPSRTLFVLVPLSVPVFAMFLANGGPALLQYQFWLAVLALVVLLPLVRRGLIQKMFRFGQCEALESLGKHLIPDRAQAERPAQ